MQFVNNDVSSGAIVYASDHNTQGSLLAAVINGGIDNSNIATGAAIATSKLANDNGIGADKLSSSAITLGYAQITANFVTAGQTAQAVTGLTATVTIPAGGRRIKITAHAPNNIVNALGSTFTQIWDGTVGSGTLLQSAKATSAGASYSVPVTAIAIVTPAAGAKTYNVSFHVDSNQGTLQAGATAPAFILVEAI